MSKMIIKSIQFLIFILNIIHCVLGITFNEDITVDSFVSYPNTYVQTENFVSGTGNLYIKYIHGMTPTNALRVDEICLKIDDKKSKNRIYINNLCDEVPDGTMDMNILKILNLFITDTQGCHIEPDTLVSSPESSNFEFNLDEDPPSGSYKLLVKFLSPDGKRAFDIVVTWHFDLERAS